MARRRRKRERELSPERKTALKALTPSTAWAAEISAGRLKKFPPPADHTPMVRCRSGQKHCGGRYFPAAYVQDGTCGRQICEDCRNHALLAWHERLEELGLIAGDETDRSDRHPFVGAVAELLHVMKGRGCFAQMRGQKPHLQT